jgi:hypothetical protein
MDRSQLTYAASMERVTPTVWSKEKCNITPPHSRSFRDTIDKRYHLEVSYA